MIKNILTNSGVFRFGEVPVKKIKFYDEIRGICAANICRAYGTNWICPPAIGTVVQCRERINSFEHAILFDAVYQLEDSFDVEGMEYARYEFKSLCENLHISLRDILPDHLLLSNGGCSKCKKCTYPDAPCRFPDFAFQALEGYGVNVSELAKLANIPYLNGKDTVTYFGMILYNE